MFLPPQHTVENLTRPAHAAFRFWISFWPVAPFFGVEWRFAEAMTPKGTSARPQKVARAGIEAQKRTIEELVKAPAVAEPVQKQALKAAPQQVEEAIEVLLEPEPKAAPSAEKVERPAKAKAGKAEKAERASKAESTDTPEPAKAENADKASEPAAPIGEPATSKAEAAARNLELDLDSGDGTPRKPKGLLKTPPETVDDLKLIRGVGPGLERQLNSLGIYTFRQIADFTDQDLAWVDANLTSFKGRCFRDDWIGQARTHLG